MASKLKDWYFVDEINLDYSLIILSYNYYGLNIVLDSSNYTIYIYLNIMNLIFE